jgi:hypothetical protein
MTCLTRWSFARYFPGAAGLLAIAQTRQPCLRIELGSAQLLAPGVPLPYLFRARKVKTVVLGYTGWPRVRQYSIHYTSRPFDGDRTRQEWKLRTEHSRWPMTSSTVHLRDGRILLFDVYAEHSGGKRFDASFRISKNGFSTLQGPLVGDTAFSRKAAGKSATFGFSAGVLAQDIATDTYNSATPVPVLFPESNS